MNIKHLCIAVMAMSMAACAGGSGKESKTDSTVEADSSVAVAEKESEEVFTSPDLTFAEVKGNVKKITETYDGKEYTIFEFDEKGFIVGEGRLEFVKKLQRDDEGFIIGGDNGYYKVTWEEGKVKETLINESDGTLLSEINTYDEKGNLIKNVSKSEGPDGDYATTRDYSYDSESYDDQGNWVSRKVHLSDGDVKDFRETRKIYYY